MGTALIQAHTYILHLNLGFLHDYSIWTRHTTCEILTLLTLNKGIGIII